MGQAKSKKALISVARDLLKAQGIGIEPKSLSKFFDFVNKASPWFIEQGEVDSETWDRVGKDLNAFLHVQGPQKVPVIAFSLWSLIKDALDSGTKDSLVKQMLDHTREIMDDIRSHASEEPAAYQQLNKELQSLNIADDDDDLDEEEAEELEEEAAKYHSDWEPAPPAAPPPLLPNQVFVAELKEEVANLREQLQLEKEKQKLRRELEQVKRGEFNPSIIHVSSLNPARPILNCSPLENVIRKAVESGEEGAQEFSLVCPVTEFTDNNGQAMRKHVQFNFKEIKELKLAASQYGPTAPFTMSIVEALSQKILTPDDWNTLGKACLSGGDYLLWKVEFYDLCKKKTALMNQQAGNVAWNADMLTGEGNYTENNNQIIYPAAVYQQIATAARRAWTTLPSKGEAIGENLIKIIQGPNEPYAEFVDRLLKTTDKIFGDTGAGIDFMKQLASENANTAYKAAIRR